MKKKKEVVMCFLDNRGENVNVLSLDTMNSDYSL